jgi:hypothetical protein
MAILSHINPSGYSLRELFALKLYLDQGEVKLDFGTTWFNKIQFYFAKRKINSVVKTINQLITVNKLNDYMSITSILYNDDDNIWDLILYAISIKTTAICLKQNSKIPVDEIFKQTLEKFLLFAQESGYIEIEILELLYEKIKTEAQMDLLFTSSIFRGNQ